VTLATALARAALAIVLTGCGGPSAHTSGAKANPPPACQVAPGSSKRAHSLVDRYCVTCHSPSGSAGEEHDFTDRLALKAQHRLVAARLRKRSMPPRASPPLEPAELDFLARWASCGAEP